MISEVLAKYIGGKDGIQIAEDKDMYPFYENGVKTKEQVKEYLRTWFRPAIVAEPLCYKNVAWYQILGFRRAFAVHMVFVNPETSEFIFFCSNGSVEFASAEDAVKQKYHFGDIYKSYDELLEGISQFYCRLWKIEHT
jgi:hypothetical protein